VFSHSLGRRRSILYRAEIGSSGWIPDLPADRSGDKMASKAACSPAVIVLVGNLW